MKTSLLLFINIVGVLQITAQPSNISPSAGRATNAPRRDFGMVISPEVHTDRTVTFRLRAPAAKEVKVGGEWGGGQALTNNGEGVWSATVGPFEPDIYGYNFTVDGLSFVDPSNPWVKPMRAARTSVLHLIGDQPALWDIKPVPHGTVHAHVYHSKSLSATRHLHVYTPPGYEKGNQSYPVLYLFHGSGDTDATWTAMGHAQYIADNLLAENKCKAMIIVMPDGHAFTGNPSQVSANLISRNVEAFSEDLLKDVMPLIENSYRVKKGAADRAIIGLSMGGGQSLDIGLKHRDSFGWVGGMSSYLPEPEKLVAEAFPAGKSELKLLWLACGKDDRLIDNARQLAAALKSKQVPHVFKESAGGHSWPVWRRYLGDFMPLIFVEPGR
jgi:enterochelin esterase-like enzyme